MTSISLGNLPNKKFIGPYFIDLDQSLPGDIAACIRESPQQQQQNFKTFYDEVLVEYRKLEGTFVYNSSPYLVYLVQKFWNQLKWWD